MMDVIVISAPAGLSLSTWRNLRRAHANLRPMEVFSEVNPFTLESRTISTPDSADVVVNGTTVGQFFWDDARLVCPLEYEERRTELESVARGVALALSATVTVVDDDDLQLKPR